VGGVVIGRIGRAFPEYVILLEHRTRGQGTTELRDYFSLIFQSNRRLQYSSLAPSKSFFISTTLRSFLSDKADDPARAKPVVIALCERILQIPLLYCL